MIQIRSLKQQIGDRLSKSTDAGLKSSADRLTAGLSAIEEEIYQVRNQSIQDPQPARGPRMPLCYPSHP